MTDMTPERAKRLRGEMPDTKAFGETLFMQGGFEVPPTHRDALFEAPAVIDFWRARCETAERALTKATDVKPWICVVCWRMSATHAAQTTCTKPPRISTRRSPPRPAYSRPSGPATTAAAQARKGGLSDG